MSPTSAVRMALLFPELLGTYGDGGNARVLAQRLRWRGLDVECLTVGVDDEVPTSCDVYLLGGGEDGPQTLAVDRLTRSAALARAVEGGAAVLAVCAGFQILGETFPGADGAPRPGLGLLACRTERGSGARRIGELVVDPTPTTGLDVLTGYENHGGVTHLDPGLAPLGRVLLGRGNDAGGGDEGAVSGKVVGTYLHGPALARNPGLADLIGSWAVGSSLAPLDRPDCEASVAELRAERMRAARTPSWSRRLRHRLVG